MTNENKPRKILTAETIVKGSIMSEENIRKLFDKIRRDEKEINDELVKEAEDEERLKNNQSN